MGKAKGKAKARDVDWEQHVGIVNKLDICNAIALRCNQHEQPWCVRLNLRRIFVSTGVRASRT